MRFIGGPRHGDMFDAREDMMDNRQTVLTSSGAHWYLREGSSSTWRWIGKAKSPRATLYPPSRDHPPRVIDAATVDKEASNEAGIDRNGVDDG